MIYYCNECDVYFNEEDIIHIRPDGGSFHEDCRKDDYDLLDESDLLERLNDYEERKTK